jgi:hypothetical protein
MSIDTTDPAMAGVTVRVTHRGQREDKSLVCPHCRAWIRPALVVMLDPSNPKCMCCGEALALEQKENRP